MLTESLTLLQPESVSWSCISSGIDWLTCSAPLGDSGVELWRQGSAIVAGEVAKGNRERPWTSHGLNGRIAGSAVVARSPTHFMVAVGSEVAAANALELLALCDNVSRLDLQLTATVQPGHMVNLADAAYHARNAPRISGKPPKRTLVQSTLGGRTCTIAARSSDVYGRVYDKGREQDTAPEGTMWRWELELKRDVARTAAAQASLCESLEVLAAELVCARMAGWGVPVPSSCYQGRHLTLSSRSPDTARLRRWLRTGVAPSVRYLIGAVGLAAVCEDLGLPAPLDSQGGQH